MFMAWTFIETFVLFMLWVGDPLHLVFLKTKVVRDGLWGVTYIETISGPVYWIRNCILCFTLTIGLIYTLFRMVRVKEKEERENLGRLCGAEFIIIFALDVSVIFHFPFDIVPICSSISILAIILQVIRGEFFRVTDQGRQWVIEHFDNAFVIVDSRHEFLDANPYAKKMFPGGTKMHSGDTFNRTYELALMDMFREEWDNSRGCSSTEGIPWYFEGVNLGEMASAGSQAVPLTDGGYWKDIWSTIKPMLYCEYDYMFKNYSNLYTAQYVSFGGWASEWDNQPVKKGEDALAAFSKCVVDFIDRGIASMTISLNSNGGLLHATTLWGYEIDNETGYVTRIWITDSDDLETEPKQELLNEYNVSAIDGDHKIAITSESVRYRKAYATQLLPLSGYGSANK